MIERYFRPGVRFLWNKPHDANAVLDGTIVNSASPASNLTYDGLDGHRAAVDPSLLATHASTMLGIAKGANVPYAWLDYAPGRTARLPAAANDILTGYMTGCLIVRGTFNGAMSTFHVGTIDNNVNASRTVKRTFAAALPADASAFNPFAAWPNAEVTLAQSRLGGINVASEKIFALVTAGGAFHSILMFNVRDGATTPWTDQTGRRYWCVGGIKQVPAMTRTTLMARLLS